MFCSENHLMINQILLSTSSELGAGGIKRQTETIPSKSGNLTKEPNMRIKEDTQVLLGLCREQSDPGGPKGGMFILVLGWVELWS